MLAFRMSRTVGFPFSYFEKVCEGLILIFL